MRRELQALNHSQRLAEWSRRVEACRNSGQTVSQWRSENGVAMSTYYGWQRKVFQAVTLKAEACFAEVPAYSAAPVMDSRAVVIRTRDLEIELLGSHEAEVAEGLAPGRDHDHLQGGGGLRILQ